MGKKKRMDQIKTILDTFKACGSIKRTAKRLNISKNTVRRYIRQSQSIPTSGFSLDNFPENSSDSLDKPALQSRETVFARSVGGWIQELRRVGVTRHLLWEEYRKKYAESYSYSQFCEHLKQEMARTDVTLSLQHNAGEVMQVDFAGKKLHWVDTQSGEVHACEVLVAVFPHSQKTFVLALPSQKVGDFVHGLNQALLFFGKLPKVILSDNLRSFVKKADRYDPDFNELCVQLAAHYQVDLDATRVGKPKDKASVENAVKTVYARIYAPLRHEYFHSLEALNSAITQQLHLHNEQPFQKKTGSSNSLFHAFEYPVMRDLPSELFEVRKTVQAKVQRNYHVFLGEHKNNYSVPFQLVGKSAVVTYNSTTVEIYINHQRVATHTRLAPYERNKYRTDSQHLPQNHQDWQKTQGYNAAYFLKEAAKIGPATQWAIQQNLLSRIYEVQTYKSCKGIIKLAEKHGKDRLEQACLRCQQAGKANYTMLKRILQMRLDQTPMEPDLFSAPKHDNIRGPETYQ